MLGKVHAMDCIAGMAKLPPACVSLAFCDLPYVVLDPTAGSGSTLIAALTLGRHAVGFEIDRLMAKQANRAIQEIL